MFTFTPNIERLIGHNFTPFWITYPPLSTFQLVSSGPMVERSPDSLARPYSAAVCCAGFIVRAPKCVAFYQTLRAGPLERSIGFYANGNKPEADDKI